MARKNPFANLMDEKPADNGVALDYTIKGASRSIISSIDELAERADRLLEGETMVELEPDLIDASFIRDRLEEDPQEFADLLAAIRERGQDTPILVRPHPEKSGRYMAVFGHRRLEAARQLGRKVRAVVKSMDDRAHVVAQGQENSARANLSFIEKAIFARRLAELDYDGDNATVMAALALDKSTLSKMLSVASLPAPILDVTRGAKSIGRDRWYEFKKLLERPANLEKVLEFIGRTDFGGLSGDAGFHVLLDCLTRKKPVGYARPPKRQSWIAPDRSVAAEATSNGKTYSLSLKSKDAVGFGDYLSANLGRLYEDFTKKRGS
ncbi:MAG: plasmid partitioning protein RepB [Rhizobium sp.]|nr:plasmid partitioning protein RepB [Rhizobium sp.]